jgi:class 3 adenylate cyclase
VEEAAAAYPAVPVHRERRHLTAMFCDLVDSTELAVRLDPEDMLYVIREYQRICGELIAQYGGRIAQYLGDGLLIYFGDPEAHEDDARRAVRAGLGILHELERLNLRLEEERNIRLSARMGIHSGHVVMGETAGHERLAFGSAVHLAARLQHFAAPDSIAISEQTLHLVRGMFVTESLGKHSVPGFPERVPIHRVLRASGVSSKLDLAGPQGLTPLAGRDEELGLLSERWSQVKDGAGQVVLVSGESGIGKSRLIRAFRERLSDEPHSWLECHGSAYRASSALFPVVELLQQALLLEPTEPPADKLAKLERALERASFTLAEAVPLFASLLALPLPQRYEPLNLSADVQRRRTLEALRVWLLGLARLQPMLLAMEDAHWFDPSTRELLGQVVAQASGAPIFVLVVSRPGFVSPRVDGSLTLAALAEPEVRSMVTGMLGGRRIPEEAMQHIVGRTDGNPLFVEEFTRMLIEGGVLVETPDGYKLEAPLPEPPAIPQTLQDLLMARLDHLGEAKAAAQVGATIGREFSGELVRVVSGFDAERLQIYLDRLVAAELLAGDGGASSTAALGSRCAIGSPMSRSRRRSF